MKLLFATLALFFSAAVATAQDWTGFYAGGSLGYGKADVGGLVDDDGFTYGVLAGYRYDFGQAVVGGEVEYSRLEFSGDLDDVNSVFRVKLQVGYDAGPALVYGTVGYAGLDVDGLETQDGIAYGVGLDYAVRPNWTVGAEILKHDFDDIGGSGLDADATTLAIRTTFRF